MSERVMMTNCNPQPMSREQKIRILSAFGVKPDAVAKMVDGPEAPPIVQFDQPAFLTPSLKVYEHLVPLDGESETEHFPPRRLYLATIIGEGGFGIVANCSISPPIAAMPHVVDWIEVRERFRGRGFATEMLRGIELHIGQPVSGESLVDKIHGVDSRGVSRLARAMGLVSITETETI